MDNLPLTETSFFILLSLYKPKHGYAIIKDVEKMSEGRVKLATGTLYSALRRMLEDGWIERYNESVYESAGEGRVRKVYKLTGPGEILLKLESDRLVALASLAMKRKIVRQEWAEGRESYQTSG